MSANRRRPHASGNSLADRIAQLEAELAALKRAHVNVTREEHDAVLSALRQVERNQHALEVQFTRIAQLQAEIDGIKRAWERMKSPV
jgi:uncharacterized small protein (DUF1192 family)